MRNAPTVAMESGPKYMQAMNINDLFQKRISKFKGLNKMIFLEQLWGQSTYLLENHLNNCILKITNFTFLEKLLSGKY